LDHPKLFRHKAPTSTPNNPNSGTEEHEVAPTNPELIANIVQKSNNVSTGNIISSFTDKLIEAKLKDDAARKKYQDDKKEKADKMDGYKKLREISNITSGSLAANNVFCISREEILEHTINKAMRVKPKAIDTQERKEAAKVRDNLQFAASFHKYKNNKKLLTKDYENILKKIQ
jgi:hypothetical protein